MITLQPKDLTNWQPLCTQPDAAPASPSSGPPWSYFLSHMQKEGGLMAHRLFTRLQEKGKASWLDVQMKARDEEAMMEGQC